jgi:protein-L-isoaspartate O-methyltransferase
MKKLKHVLLLFWLVSAVNVVCGQQSPFTITDAENISLNEIWRGPYVGLSTSFPGIDIEQLKNRFAADQSSVKVPTDEGQDVGFNKNTFSTLMHYLFRSIQTGENILEVGAGSGYTSARLLLTNAAQVHTLELSRPAAKAAGDVFKSYKTLCPSGKVFMKDRLKMKVGNIVNETFTEPRYDSILFFNVLHYMNPTDVNAALHTVKSGLKPNGRIVISVNTPYGPVAKEYVRAKNEHSLFPGYISYNVRNNAMQDIQLLPDTDSFSPVNNKAINASTKQYCFHFFDKTTMERLLTENGYAVETIYYESSQAIVTADITDEQLIASDRPFCLQVIARLN